MSRKWVYFCFVFILLSVSIIGCGEENKQGEIETIYSNVFKSYQDVKPIIYGALVETGEEIIDEAGQIYLLVREPEYQDIKSIRDELDSAFSDAYIETYLSWVLGGKYPLYKEIDGQLCVAMADAIGEDITEEIISVLEHKENYIKIVVAGDLNSYEITLIQEEGRWVIDQIQ